MVVILLRKDTRREVLKDIKPEGIEMLDSGLMFISTQPEKYYYCSHEVLVSFSTMSDEKYEKTQDPANKPPYGGPRYSSNNPYGE
ncbi:MAG: hypothetical protein Tp152SUR00d2C52646391_71 [Prokaryotic dsDNA virus sp.]|nr:MAG: hypothetical protein Tp152SUR00d2C52646391_71 [Prokaryotic dsDNA virus sp.]|tara:strand:- start:2842 stop:3096 length:255 start_codon:yes stop_codon:yes gene_type:complete